MSKALFLFLHKYLEVITALVLLIGLAATSFITFAPMVLIIYAITIWHLTREARNTYFDGSGRVRSWVDIQNKIINTNMVMATLTFVIFILTTRTLLAK